MPLYNNLTQEQRDELVEKLKDQYKQSVFNQWTNFWQLFQGETTVYTEERPNVGRPWDHDTEDELISLIYRRKSLAYICSFLGRNERGIFERAKKLRGQRRLDVEGWQYIVVSFEDWESNYEYEPIDYTTKIELKEIPVMEKAMGNNRTWTMVSLLQEDIITLTVAFDGNVSRQYTYKTRDTSIKEEDFVIVNPGGKEGKYSVGQVMVVHETPQIEPESGLRYHWVVGKLNTREYDMLVQNDERAYEMLVNAEKHVARKKLMDLYTESLQLNDASELQKLLGNTSNDTDTQTEGK